MRDAGNVDRDGLSDSFVADVFDNRLGPGSDRAYVFSGTSSDKLRIFNAEKEGDGFDIAHGGRDLDGDGRADFIIAAYTYSAVARQAGKVYLYSGKTGKVPRIWTGTTAGDQLGFDALPPGDVSGDGIGDFQITRSNIANVLSGAR